MSADIFYTKPTKGIIYGLFSTDQPTQLRYIGQTLQAPVTRLAGHHGRPQSKKMVEWTKLVSESGHQIGMRILGTYPKKVLNKAELKWIRFWDQYCDLLNYVK
jgi:hypothetical protein